MIADATEDQEQILVEQEQHQLLHRLLADSEDKMNDKERFILEHRLLADEPKTLAEVGEHFGVSRERIRQLEQRVITKLRDAAHEIDLAA